MTRRWGTRGPVATAIALLLATAACGLLPPEPVPTSGFWLRYEKAAPADEADARFLRNWQLAEFTLADLNDYVDLPHLVTVRAKSCHGEGTGYDPDTRTIELCYDDLAEQREHFDDEDLSELVRETIYHEAGHALIDALDLPDEGARAEEDAADRFAQVALLTRDPEGDDTLLMAARAYDLSAAADPTPDPTDEHAPDATRAESHRCAVQGAFPTRHKSLATPARADCAATWTRTRDAWLEALVPLLVGQ
ncbi:DUF4344 domain-containing metallopeptidase [Streptomyces sp. NBC_00335]|uniref:DUF4344 domain-containing metallopeptidase n=1 Tax=unclassified Streptomyces TaxID=2593676 RepID=UPI00225905C8|nr:MULTISPECIES: DUF4344 domain-containing metallopeptidase [unclassified Streptomyces]MCX5404986.1 DUF4344 domain-containing metallopeptidase [Streptomyces sp. NBC_00086]